eukprot:scaffold4029_cov117-Isochrysis_galbana.AAC.5
MTRYLRLGRRDKVLMESECRSRSTGNQSQADTSGPKEAASSHVAAPLGSAPRDSYSPPAP